MTALVVQLDDVIARPQFRMRHARVVSAPPAVVWDELQQLRMSALPLAWTLEAARLLPARLAGRRRPRMGERTYLEITPIPVLYSDPPTIVIAAGLSQAWRLLGGSTPPDLDATALRAWSRPGWVKAGMEFRLEPHAESVRLSTETRVLATDPATRRAFRAYWWLIRPSAGAIRREVLRVVAHRAEARASSG